MNDDNVIDVYITKYALSRGIMQTTARLCRSDSGQMIELIGGTVSQYYHGEGRDWHRTKEAAVKRANEMRMKKIASLKKQIKKLESLLKF